ncbi:CsiV family protein [Thalassotalea atypica]|uniref:CsiV family protein n=1 Tax=Thalassotalea atypica TaxID=2054316 RepID=UPI0025732BAD|nr:CsiV family protein [Thalassotalea atypica]
MKAYLSLVSASVVFISATVLSGSVQAAEKKIDKRWFEVEVILFRQLGDKSQLKERFEQNSTLPNYRTFDLLGQYLQPNLAQIKYQLPSCDAKHYPKSLLEQSAELPAFFTPLTLEKIDQQVTLEQSDFMADQTLGNEATLNIEDAAASNILNEPEPYFEEDEQALDELSNVDELNTEVILLGLSDEEITAVSDAEKAFPALVFNYSHLKTNYFTYKTDGSRRKLSTLCQYISSNPLSPRAYTTDTFPVHGLTGRVDGNEFVHTDNPYLIDSDSLQLKDIYLQLRRSKNFRPMLHLGWRQTLINRKPADQNKALKLFAGEHFHQNYLDQQQNYQNRLEQLSIEQWLAQQHESITDDIQNTETSTQSLLDEKLLPAETMSPTALKTNFILETIDQLNIAPEQLLAEIDAPNLHADVLAKLNTDELAASTEIQEPNPPIQSWYLDGLFRLHLSHYLYITADFNVSSHSAAELATQSLEDDTANAEQTTWHSIPFSQNRRVISGEVHYFDHPYMGMIVQIRRYKKPELEQDPEETGLVQ